MIRSTLLQGLEDHQVRAVLEAATSRRFPARAIIYEQGDSASSFYQLSTGRARYYCLTHDGRKSLLHWLAPGDILGISSVSQPTSKYRVSAETVQDSSLLVWERQTMLTLIELYPRLLHNALSVATGYFDLYVAAYLALVSDSARQRLASVLSHLSSAIGREGPRGVELQVTNEELANAANITLFTASRILSEWQRDHALTKRRGRIILHSTGRLFRLTA